MLAGVDREHLSGHVACFGKIENRVGDIVRRDRAGERQARTSSANPLRPGCGSARQGQARLRLRVCLAARRLAPSSGLRPKRRLAQAISEELGRRTKHPLIDNVDDRAFGSSWQLLGEIARKDKRRL